MQRQWFPNKKRKHSESCRNLQPKLIALSETKLSNGNPIKTLLPEYEICSKPTEAGKRGLAICVKLQTFQSILDVTSTTLNDILSVRIVMGAHTIRVILGYAPQETEKIEIREAFYTDLDIEITNCEMECEIPIVMGDMNAKLTTDGSQIIHISPNGKLLLDILNRHDMDVLNFQENCSGKLTHVIRTTGEASVLDYIFTSPEITKTVKETLIDEECLFCPFRVLNSRGIIKPKFSDHNAIITKLCIPHQGKKPSSSKKWKITKEGLEKFKQLTTNEAAFHFPTGDAQVKYNKVEEELNMLMEKCFRKVRPKKNDDVCGYHLAKYKEVMQFARKGKAQRKVAYLYIKEIIKLNTNSVAAEAKEKVKITLEKLTIDNKFSPNQFWELCKRHRNNHDNCTSIITEGGQELFGNDLIANAYLEEFVHPLKKREIVPELKNYEKRTEQICQLYLEEAKSNIEPYYTSAEYQNVRNNLKRGKSCGRDLFPPDIFIKGGDQLHEMLLALFNTIKSADTTIHQWTLVMIATIYKNKGRRKELVNHRGIFLKQILSKMFEKLNMNRISKSVEKIDKSQGGSRPNRSPAD